MTQSFFYDNHLIFSFFVLNDFIMSTAELKTLLISRIAAINDKTLLDVINELIDTKSEQQIYQTTPEQRKSIEEGQAQIERGEYLTHDQFEKEIDQWLKEK